MKKTILRNYARLIAKTGANVQKGQKVIILAGLDQPEFVRMLAEECFACGASDVTVDWQYQPLDKVRQKKATLKTLSEVEDWEIAKIKRQTEILPVKIYLESEDPDGLSGINQEKYAKALQARKKVFKPFRDQMENKYQWCIAAVPGVAWAKKMFPNLSKNQAVEALWNAILKASRADVDPIAAWQAHNEDLQNRCNYLNRLHIKELYYKASNGTDLRVGLLPDVVFAGGAEAAEGSGIVFNPNIPSEEVFTSPRKGDADGVVFASKPLSYQGELIENFSIRFEKGKAVEVHAEKGENLLKELISMDDGAAYLGECALVPFNSPIRNSGLTFFNTLFDENAACHLALGIGFTNLMKDYDKMPISEAFKRGINDSIIHVDFMIGTSDLSVSALTENGNVVPIFQNGNWAF